MSGYTVDFGTLTINSGSGGITSSVLSDSDALDKIEELTIYAPASLTGTVNVQINYTSSLSASEWRNANYKGTNTAIALSGNNSSVIFDTHATAGYRLSSSVAEAGPRTFKILGSYDTEVKALP